MPPTTVGPMTAYDLEVNYRLVPAPPLTGGNAEWSSRLLREKGLI